MILAKFLLIQKLLMAVLLKLFPPFPLLHNNHRPQYSLSHSLFLDLKLFTLFLCREITSRSSDLIKTWRIPISQTLKTLYPTRIKSNTSFETESFRATVLDLPELAVHSILAKLSASDLCSMACVCRSLRDNCRSDELWERHVREKWGGVVGERRGLGNGVVESKDSTGGLAAAWPLSWIRRKKKMEGGRMWRRSLRANSSLADFYAALQSGRLSFPAQVFNRENGRTGFLMSCYDAELSYNARTNKFLARYPPHGKRTAATESVPWERTRAPPVVTSPHELHNSVCLSELKPGDHFEIQWRRNKESPYGWWYGVVGHLEMCGTSEHYWCCCHESDTIVLEFKHYAEGSRWRRKTLDRKEHTEDGNENDGFHGGIRKIREQEDVSKWMQFWPVKLLE